MRGKRRGKGEKRRGEGEEEEEEGSLPEFTGWPTCLDW